MSKRHTRATGFTIVELLIVVVIIAILAAITLVTYNGIQQRATNTAIIDAASKSIRMIEAYIAANGAYPLTISSSSISACITKTSGCYQGAPLASNGTFDSSISTIGTPPRTVPIDTTAQYGVIYWYTPTRTMNGQTQPAILVYFLSGNNQSCGVTGTAETVGGDSSILVASTTGYTTNIGTQTQCRVSIPGPSA